MNIELLGDNLISWTIRLALVCYTCVLMGWLVPSLRPIVRQHGRFVWLAGVIIFVTHVACAFGFRHHWSHAHAFQHTADVTGEMLGWRFGAGIYFSYLFLLTWIADAIWWFLRPQSYWRRARALTLSVHFYMFFIAFNGAVVFEDGPTRWAGAAASLVLVGLLLRNVSGTKVRSKDSSAHQPDSNHATPTIEHPAHCSK